MIASLVIIVLLLLCVFLVGCVAYLKYRRRYTRERYAFAALGATLAIVSLALGSIAVAPPWIVIAELFNEWAGKPSSDAAHPHWSESFLMIGICGWALWLLHRNFTNWNGPVSERDMRKARLHEESSLVFEGLTEAARVFKQRAPSPTYLPTQQSAKWDPMPVPSEQRAWREDARELMELSSQQIAFDSTDGWHERHHCWLGEDVRTGGSVALMCPQYHPTEGELEEFIQYVQSLKKDAELFVLLKGAGEFRNVEVANTTIMLRYENGILDNLVDFGDYRTDIRRRVETERLPDSELAVNDVYSVSGLTDGSGHALEKDLETYLVEWTNETSQRQIAILGEYGQGKSTGTLMFTYNCLFGRHVVSRIPILIELRGKSPSTLEPVELLGAWASIYRIDPLALLKLHAKGRLCLIFEGFDEMAGISNIESRINHFRALWKFCYPTAKLLFTGRPNFFLDDTELKSALGVSASLATGPYCDDLHMRPFNIEQIQHSLRWCSAEIRNEIVSIADKNATLFDIVSRPSLLYIVARLWNTPEFSRIRDRATASDVMGAFLAHCHRRQSEKQRNSTGFMLLQEEERKYFIDGIAVFMTSNNLNNQIVGSQLDQAVAELYEVIPESFASVATLPQSSTSTLKTRLADRDDALEAIQTDVRTYGLLVKDYSRPNALKFPHKSFFEYLTGSFLARSILNVEPEYCAAIQAATGFVFEDTLAYPEVLMFTGDIVARNAAREQNASTADVLLERIVFPRRRRLPRSGKLLLLRMLVSRFSTRFFFRSYMAWGCALSILALFGARIVGYNEPEVILRLGAALILASPTCLIAIILVWIITNYRKPLIWYYIVRNMKISDQELSQKYGAFVVRCLKKQAENKLTDTLD